METPDGKLRGFRGDAFEGQAGSFVSHGGVQEGFRPSFGEGFHCTLLLGCISFES